MCPIPDWSNFSLGLIASVMPWRGEMFTSQDRWSVYYRFEVYLAMSAKTNPLAPPFPLHVALRKVHSGNSFLQWGDQDLENQLPTLKHFSIRGVDVGQWTESIIWARKDVNTATDGAFYSELELGPFLRPPKVSTTFTNLRIKEVKHEVGVKQSKIDLLTYWILLLARPVFFFFFSPASTLGVWPLTWRMW